jgi:hypothetical protein
MGLTTCRLVMLLAWVSLVAPLAASAQPAGKVWRLGYLASGAIPTCRSAYEKRGESQLKTKWS